TLRSIPNERSTGNTVAGPRSEASVRISDYLPTFIDLDRLGIGPGTECSQILHSILRIPKERPQLVTIGDTRPEVGILWSQRVGVRNQIGGYTSHLPSAVHRDRDALVSTLR